MEKFYAGELAHFGILGMKWGIRRFENSDGTLTEAGKKRYGKIAENEYKKAGKETDEKIKKDWYKSYNKAANYMNSGGIDAFNKLNTNYGSNDYNQSYEKIFNKLHSKYYNADYYEIISNNKHYKKGKEITDKYKNLTFKEAHRMQLSFDGMKDLEKDYNYIKKIESMNKEDAIKELSK